MHDIISALKVTAVWERVPQEQQQEWINKSQQGLVEGVSVDQERKQIKVNCVLSGNGEITPVVRISEKPDWFRLSVSCPVTMRLCAVTNDVREIMPVVKDSNREEGKQFKLLFFRNGTVVRFFRTELVADYLGVRAEGSKFFLIRTPRLNLEIPRFVQNKDELREFLAGKVPADLEETVCEIVAFQDETLVNPDWGKGLEAFKTPASPVKSTATKAASYKDRKPRTPKPDFKQKHDPLRKVRGMSSKDAAGLSE